MIRQCAILFGCLALGELVVFLTDIKLPSSIIGMLLLTLFLKLVGLNCNGCRDCPTFWLLIWDSSLFLPV